MLLLTATTDKIECITGQAVTVDVHTSFMDITNADPPVVKGSTSGRKNTAISTAATTDISGSPASGNIRNIKSIVARNKGASSVDVTIQFNQNGTVFELHKATLKAGECLEFIDGVGFFVVTAAGKLDAKLRVAADVTFATAATFSDITGLTAPVSNGKHYNFEAHLYHIGNATTTGAQFGINGPTMTGMRIQTLDVIAGSVTAATMGSNAGDVTARDTAAAAETTGAATVALAILSGWFNPSADGTFAVRATSEVSVAAGLIVKQGSWCRIWEADN